MNKRQSQHTLKTMMQSTWKAESDLRIVEVGSSIYQFKFLSEYQMKSIETNGPWSFKGTIFSSQKVGKGNDSKQHLIHSFPTLAADLGSTV